MTPIAQQATWSTTTAGPHIPTQWIIEKHPYYRAYEISAVDNDLCGFPVLRTARLYEAIDFIKNINETGRDAHFERSCNVGAFSNRNNPLPTTQILHEIEVSE